MKRVFLFFAALLIFSSLSHAQKKVLFDATKAETANNADWIIDADQWNLGYSNGSAYIGGGEANAQRYPTPDQSGITSSTDETYWTGALSAWAVELVQAGYYVETLPYDGRITYGDNSNPQDLANYDMYVVCEPNFPFTSSEKEAIINFVHDGGVLFMISDHTNSDRDSDGWDSPAIWNDLMDNNPVKSNPFGILFDYEYFSEKSAKIVNEPDNPILHGPYGDVTRVDFYGGTSMTLYPDANPNVHALVYRATVAQTTGNTRVIVAYVTYGRGIVFAIGDSSPLDDSTGDNNDRLYNGWFKDANGSHRILIMNASVWALEHTLSSVDSRDPLMPFKVLTAGHQLRVLPVGAQSFSMRIYSITGSLLQDVKARGMYTTDLPSGVYILQLAAAHRVFRQKVVLF